MQILSSLKRQTHLFAAVLLIMTIITAVVPPAVSAQNPAAIARDFGILARLVNEGLGLAADAINIAAWVPNIFESLINALLATLLGDAWNQTAYEYFEDVKYARKEPNQQGLLGTIDSANTNLLTNNYPNLNTSAYFKSVLANNIIMQPAYAQTGVSYIAPISHMWGIMRNISYALAVVVLAAMGLMVMFRQKISAHAVMTVQQAIPRLAIALILITFSFPIGGLLIDVGRVLKALIDNMFCTGSSSIMSCQNIRPFAAVGIFDPQSFLSPIVGSIMSIIGTFFTPATIFNNLVKLILAIFVLVISFKLFFTLLMAFTKLFVSVLFSPFAFLWGALPGQEDTTTRWFKGFLVNVLTFPVVYFLFNLAVWFEELSAQAHLALPNDLGWGGVAASATVNLSGIIGIGLLITATKVPAMLEDAFAVTTSGAVAGAGVDLTKVAKKIPVVGNAF